MGRGLVEGVLLMKTTWGSLTSGQVLRRGFFVCLSSSPSEIHLRWPGSAPRPSTQQHVALATEKCCSLISILCNIIAMSCA